MRTAAASPDARADAVDRSGADGALLVDESRSAAAPLPASGGSIGCVARSAMQTDWHGAALRDLLGTAAARSRSPRRATESADLDTPGDARRWHAR